MARKTKAQLEAELAELRATLAENRKTAPQEDAEKPAEPLTQSSFRWQDWLPTILAVVVIAVFVVWQNTRPSVPPGPQPEPEKTLEQIVAEVIPSYQRGYSEVFELAASEIDAGKIQTDKQLFEFVEPSLIKLRAERQRPFDQIFELSLPREDDGKLKAKEAAEFLRRIAKSW